MERKEYSGWTNYETWLANLWMDNDEGLEEYWRERALRCAVDSTDAEEAADMFAGELEADADERAEQIEGPGFMADLIRAGLREVNWQEIAEHWIAGTNHEWPTDESEES